jgi:hypothetical protein
MEIIPGKTAASEFYPASVIDHCTGYLVAFGVMSRARRARDGGRR